jgi:hypothetical protein
MTTLRPVALVLALLLLPLSAPAGENIVPVSVWTDHLTFADGTFLIAEVPQEAIPDGVTAIVGWSGWIYQTNPLALYSEVKLWHDGGTPHMLWSDVWTCKPSEGATWNNGHCARAFPSNVLPLSGHRMVKGDRLFVEIRCVPKPSPGKAKCESNATFYLKVVD